MTTAMEWTENLSVGIPSIDKQHKKLIELFNTFYESIHNKVEKDKMLSVINGLKEYTVQHFKSEEVIMKIHNYPRLNIQIKSHDSFVKSVLDFEERYKQGKLLLTIEIVNFIKDWITKHIMEEDKLYTTFLTQRGVK
jgi:hemerythrin-like metal-binding protein